MRSDKILWAAWPWPQVRGKSSSIQSSRLQRSVKHHIFKMDNFFLKSLTMKLRWKVGGGVEEGKGKTFDMYSMSTYRSSTTNLADNRVTSRFLDSSQKKIAGLVWWMEFFLFSWSLERTVKELKVLWSVPKNLKIRLKRKGKERNIDRIPISNLRTF